MSDLKSMLAQWQTPLLQSVTCPNCWHSFLPEDVLWIAVSPSLGSDPQLPASVTGMAEPLRFLPDRFDADGKAIDAGGQSCTCLACPRCRLSIPRSSLELAPVIISVVGSPGSGKSVFLAAQSYALETSLNRLGLAADHADLQLNSALVADVNRLFKGAGVHDLQRIDEAVAKTSEQADPRWRASLMEGREVRYVPPYVYNVRPFGDHPSQGRGIDLARLLCLYDNAGEHFRSGADSTQTPVTRHLAKANGILFTFDPLREPYVRNRLGLASATGGAYDRQDVILNEAANRVRQHAQLSPREQIPQPLVVVLAKFDKWRNLLPAELPNSPYAKHPKRDAWCLRLDRIDAISHACREFLLQNKCDEIVRTAEQQSPYVRYVPVAAVGMVTRVDSSGRTLYKPAEAKPFWAELPLMILLSKSTPSLVTWVRKA